MQALNLCCHQGPTECGNLQHLASKIFCKFIFYRIVEEGIYKTAFVFNSTVSCFKFLALKKWSQPMHMNLGVPTARAAHGMCTVGRNIVIFGGRDTEKRTNDIHIYNVGMH